MAEYSTNAIQAGDVLMFHVEDRGEIEEKNGFITMTDSLETMIYLSLFGGNEDDNGSESTSKLQWWGNEGEPIENQYRGKFQSLLSGSPLTSASVTVLVEAAVTDLETAIVATGYAESVEISEIEIVTSKHIKLTGFVTQESGRTVVPFVVEGEVL